MIENIVNNRFLGEIRLKNQDIYENMKIFEGQKSWGSVFPHAIEIMNQRNKLFVLILI